MVIELLMLSSTILLLVVLTMLLIFASKELKPKRRFKVKEDIQKIKDQITS